MNDVVAVRVELGDGGKRYFVTWGRIQDPVDTASLEELVLRFAHKCSLGGEPMRARVCDTLREAAESDSAPYFFECFFEFASNTNMAGVDFEQWRAERAQEMAAGRQSATAVARDLSDSETVRRHELTGPLATRRPRGACRGGRGSQRGVHGARRRPTRPCDALPRGYVGCSSAAATPRPRGTPWPSR